MAAERFAVYEVLPDFEAGGKAGADAIAWIESDDPDVNIEQAQLQDILGNPGPLKSKWAPYPARYVQQGRRPIPASFYDFGSFLAASAVAKKKLSSIADIEWLPLDPVHDTPPELAVKGSPSFYIMRFARTVIPHRLSKFTYFPGTSSIQEIISLVLSKEDAEDLYAFRLEGNPVTPYATQKFVDICERERLRGLEFMPIACQFK
jgi:hypothetical protein